MLSIVRDGIVSNVGNINAQLRKIVDGTGGFMTSHQIINSNRANAGPLRKTAQWSKSDKKVRQLLLRVFPRMATDVNQRVRAGKWLRVIQLYYRSGFSYGDTALELNESKKFVENVLYRISRALRGLPCNRGKKLRKLKEARTFLGDE